MTIPPGNIPDPVSHRTRRAAVAGALLVASLAAFAAVGQTNRALGAISAVLWVLCASFPAALYLVSAVGLGRLARPLYRGLSDEFVAQVALGLSIQFTLSHLLGWTGLLCGGAGAYVSAVPIAGGLFLFLGQGVATIRKGRAWDLWVGLSLFSVPVIGLLLVAACNPPGWLWATEFGGYDALSYHLQLPQEWLAAGRIGPLTHNVYSYLPSYFESAFMHVAVLAGIPARAGLLAHDGRAALACQVLHALTAVAAAAFIARVTFSLIVSGFKGSQASIDHRARHAAALAGGFFIATPWVVVVGSLAYNEMALAALFAAALGIAADRSDSHVRRWVLAAWLVGVACGVKPTALTFTGVPVALMLLGTTPARCLLRAGPAAIAAGLLALSPWLARNYVAGGNPVFPYLSGLFGAAHWTPDQIARYIAGHHTDLPWADRFRLLVFLDPNDPAGPRHRGLLHPQWGAFFPLVLAAVATSIARVAPTRRVSILLTLGLVAQLVLWLTTTHLQSRFLLPLAVPGAILLGMAMLTLLNRTTRLARPLVSVVAALPIVVQSAASTLIFSSQQGGQPNDLLTVGPGLISGDIFRAELDSTHPSQRAALLGDVTPEVFCNLTLGSDSVLYLLGDATPFYFRCSVVYHTMWDTSPLGEAVRASPSDPAGWTGHLRARGVTHVLLNAGEIDRHRRSGGYDSAMNTDAIFRWLESSADLVQSWPQQGRFLFRLR